MGNGGDEGIQFGDGGVDIVLLPVEQVDPRLALGDRHAALFLMGFVRVIEVDHLADFGKAEPHPLAAQDPGQPRPVAPRINARQTLPLRRDQPFILLEAQRARRDAELFRQIGDAVALPVAMVGQFDARDAAAIVHRDRDNGTLRLRQGEWVGWDNLCR